MIKNKIVSCESCIDGKLIVSSTSFPTRIEKSSILLEIVHADVCGPMRTSSKGGAYYILTFTDDYSGWCEVFFLAHKSEVPAKLIEYKNLVENQTGHKIEALQSDNGKEFCNAAKGEILKKSGIRRRLATTYTYQQNGVTEHKNRTLIEGENSR